MTHGSKQGLRGYELGFFLGGRPVEPFHLAITIATGMVCYLTFGTASEGWTDAFEIIIGATAFSSTMLLLSGWLFRNYWASEWGMLLASGVWFARAALLILGETAMTTAPWYGSVVFSLAWAIGALGAYIIERYDRYTVKT